MNNMKHDIEEMAKGQVGLKWAPLFELKLHIIINLTSNVRKIRHKRSKIKTKTRHVTKVKKLLSPPESIDCYTKHISLKF